MKIIKQNSEKLKNDIIQFLDIEKLERNQTFYDHDLIIDLSLMLKNIILLFKGIASKKNIIISHDISGDIYIKIDPSAVERILNNILDNSIKYTNKGGMINISLAKVNNKVIFEVSDSGIGMTKSQQKYIFNPFVQVHNKKSNIDGIGLGLNIVKKILDQINGEILVESKLNKGTKFIIKFSNYNLMSNDNVLTNIHYLKPLTNIINIKLKKENYKKDRFNILLVEDNIEMLSFLQDSLYDTYNVFFAKNGIEALEKLRNIPKPDIIISDIMMDKMDGFELYEKLINIKEYSSIPLIFVTALISQNDKIKSLSKGAVDFITKPFNIKELLAKVSSIIKIQQALKDKLSFKKDNIINEYLKNEDKKTLIIYQEYHITKKQIEIINLLKTGLERKEIAHELNVSLNTINTQMSRLFSKCNVQNKTELLNIFK